MFTTEHFIWLGISFVMICTLLICSVRFKWSKKTCVYIICGISVLSELTKLFSHINYDGNHTSAMEHYMLAKSLPFHLCSILIFVYFYLALSKNEERKEKLLSFVVPTGLFGGLLGIVMATGETSFCDPSSYQSFIYHAGILWFSLYCILTKQVKMEFRDYFRNCAALFALAIVSIWINSVLQVYNTNFFFTVEPPAKDLPVLNTDHGWYVYFVHLLTVGFFCESAVCLPLGIKSRKKRGEK